MTHTSCQIYSLVEIHEVLSWLKPRRWDQAKINSRGLLWFWRSPDVDDLLPSWWLAVEEVA